MPDSPTPNVWGYNGEDTDSKTGLQYLRARYYDTNITRFLQEDDYRGELSEPETLNRYTYVHNNPVMGIDPSGYTAEVDALYNNWQKKRSAYQSAQKKVDALKAALAANPAQYSISQSLSSAQTALSAAKNAMDKAWSMYQTAKNGSSSSGSSGSTTQNPDDSNSWNGEYDYAVDEWNEYPEGQIDLSHIPYQYHQIYELAYINNQNTWDRLKEKTDKWPEYIGRVSESEIEYKKARNTFVKELAAAILTNLPTLIIIGSAIAAAIAVVAGTGGLALAVFALAGTMLAVSATELVDLGISTRAVLDAHSIMKSKKEVFDSCKEDLSELEDNIEYLQRKKEFYKNLYLSIENGTYNEGDEKNVPRR